MPSSRAFASSWRLTSPSPTICTFTSSAGSSLVDRSEQLVDVLLFVEPAEEGDDVLGARREVCRVVARVDAARDGVHVR